jgi:hypothetical protein
MVQMEDSVNLVSLRTTFSNEISAIALHSRVYGSDDALLSLSHKAYPYLTCKSPPPCQGIMLRKLPLVISPVDVIA